MTVIEFKITQKEMYDHGYKVPPIYLLIEKGLKTIGRFDPAPIGVVEWWDHPESGDRHIKQTIN